MGFDSVQTRLGSQAVHPGQDAHDDREPDSPQLERSKRPRPDRRAQGGPHPVLNALGQVIGQAVDITA